MKKLTTELKERFGITGNGKLTKVDWSGREGTDITVSEFEAWSGATCNKRQSNEEGTEDCKLTLIDEKNEDFTLTLEIKNEVITHSYY